MRKHLSKSLGLPNLYELHNQSQYLTYPHKNSIEKQMPIFQNDYVFNKVNKLSFIPKTSYSNDKNFQNVKNKIVDMSIKKINKDIVNSLQKNDPIEQIPNFKDFEMASGQRSSETTKEISSELEKKLRFDAPNFVRSNKLDEETQTNRDVENENQNVEAYKKQDEYPNDSSIDLSEQKKKYSDELSNTLLWTSIGLVSLIGIGLYWKHKQRNKTK